MIKIKMTKRATTDIGFYPPKEILVAEEGQEYEAKSNPQGAIYIEFGNGKKLGIRPGEFEFVEAPAWVLEKHGKLADIIGRDVLLSQLKQIIPDVPGELTDETLAEIKERWPELIEGLTHKR